MAGSGETMPTKQRVEKCEIGDSIVRNVDHAERGGVLPGDTTEQLQTAVERMELANAEMLIIHVRTNDFEINEESRFYNGRSAWIGVRCKKKKATELQTCPEWKVEACHGGVLGDLIIDSNG
jgi:hypothetical protein